MPRLYPDASRYQLKGKALGVFSTWLKMRSSKVGLELAFYLPGSKDGFAFYLLYMHKLWLLQPSYKSIQETLWALRALVLTTFIPEARKSRLL